MALDADRSPPVSAHRGVVLHFHSDPGENADPASFEWLEDGLLVISRGRIEAVGPARELLPRLPPGAPVVEHGDNILMPGFVDTHIHYPQTDVIASGGRQLLDWLEEYTFPAERQFSDPAHACAVADFFLDELIRNGTTTALVFCTVHRASVDAFFEAAMHRGMRMAAGKVLMDRNAPGYLHDTVAEGERESRELLERWHNRDRLTYAITPRFAATSSEEQLASTGRLAQQFPDAIIQSHLAESLEEVAWIRRLFPQSRSYLDVYDGFGLLRERSIYAHCIYLDETDRGRMARSGATAAFCPSSNLYLGSGLFDVGAADVAEMPFTVATDVGGGSSFSMLRTLGDAYKVAQLSGHALSPVRAFYLATLAGARALGLDGRIGRFAPGCEADFIVLDVHATPLISRRMARARTVAEKLLVLMTLGDDRVIASTYVLGRPMCSPQQNPTRKKPDM
jgi:guanine deaminase